MCACEHIWLQMCAVVWLLNVFHAFCQFLFKPFAVPRTHIYMHIVCAPGLTSFDFSLLLSHIISVLASCLSQGNDLCVALTYQKPAVDGSQPHTIPLPLTVCLIYSQPPHRLSFSLPPWKSTSKVYQNSKGSGCQCYGGTAIPEKIMSASPRNIFDLHHLHICPEPDLAQTPSAWWVSWNIYIYIYI